LAVADGHLGKEEMNELQVSLDRAREVVTIRRAGARIADSRDAEHDTYLFLDLDDENRVVGVRLVAANEMPPDYWQHHPDRASLPRDILSKLDELIPELYNAR
jgi:hypothetical protein